MGSASSRGSSKHDRDWLLQTLDEHESAINCMTLSSDGSVLATGSDDHNICLWSAKTTPVECLGVLTGHVDYITSILIDEHYLVSASADRTMRKWDITNGRCVFVYSGHTSLINRIVCTGDFLFSTSYDRTARCWDFDTGACVRVFRGHKHGVLPILFIPAEHSGDGDKDLDKNMNIYAKDLIITGSQDTTAKTWSFETGECLKTFRGHTGAILCLATDRVGKILFTGSSDNSIRAWDIYRGTEIRVYEQHQAAIISLLCINKLLFSISSDHTARCWVIDVGDCTRIYKGHKHTVSCIQVHNGHLFTGCGDSIVRCFDARSGVIKRIFKSHTLSVNCLQIVDDKLFSGSVDGTLKVWNIGDLNRETIANSKPSASSSKVISDDRISVENRSDVDSGIDDREYRDRHGQNMV
ncbi:unnamed protein product [Rotaria magnacalcarata]|uniref:WD repeat-containing protein 86 n=1 Tax=Rotaria magnacalcarata TaxID=392030 RepID=A0A816QA98_9BILA|nr:unnamed protein product [Rotaria magnacalcarata]CAF2067513.1 unnamed protein product [Rotaria magnacalcarata]CAF3871625.1 unnamed protein product [Rotaria magnacalcarata]CAF3966398.1 unnamed protein product [Rotaria magnacalcarata]